MTTPIEPTPGAPAAVPTPPNIPDVPATPAEDVTALPEWAQKQLRDARAEAGKARTTAKATAADEARAELTAQLAKALGIGQEGQPVDPAELTAQIARAQADSWRSGVELQVHRMAGRLGANADALLDSLSFVDSLDDLVDADPRSAEFSTALEAKVQAALERNSSYKATGQAPAAPTGPRPDPSQGARGTTPGFAGKSMSEAIRAHYGG